MNTPTAITVLSPAGQGVSYVRVETVGGDSNSLPYYYLLAPHITELSANAGPTAGGNTIEIYGYNLETATYVDIGGNLVTPTIINDGEITVVAPANFTGDVNIIVTTNGGTSEAIHYKYVDTPTITNISPTSGSTLGADDVTIIGTNFTTALSVTVNGTNAEFGVINDTAIAIYTPPGIAGICDIVVATEGGSATAVGIYTYISPPGI